MKVATLKGGFAIFEDFDGPEQWNVFESQMTKPTSSALTT
jgi:hypothetical protein